MEDVLIQMITDSRALKKGLEALGGTVTAFINEYVKSGAHSVWYLTNRASKEIVTKQQYQGFGAFYDERVFKETPYAIHIAHICGIEPYFDLVDKWRKSFGVKGFRGGSRTPILTSRKQRITGLSCASCPAWTIPIRFQTEAQRGSTKRFLRRAEMP